MSFLKRSIMIRRILKIVIYTLISITGIVILILFLLFAGLKPPLPDPPTDEISKYDSIIPIEKDSNLFILENNWIRKNSYGLWEMYIEGSAFDRGVAAGKLSEHLVKQQEEVFVSQIQKILPSKNYQRFLLTSIAWLNRKLTKNITPEYLKEIYGISLSASHKFDRFGPAYLRLLNYHAAHDIGHAMQSYYLVGCSSFAAWNENTKDSTLIVGRNFDFYFGEEFAENKIIEFVSPDSGFNFVFITWGGMIGVVSGMNDQGLTVTINAGTMHISPGSATPVTLLAREILQYADNIDKAIEIAQTRKIMVSESFLISSATDKKAIIIEKKPESMEIVWPDSSLIVCTNHFQGKEFSKLEDNIANEENNATGYRYKRLQELILKQKHLEPESVASILRDKKGLNNASIGYGNEKALNQLLAHHSVIFEPEKGIVRFSNSPNVMGTYVAYDLNKIFNEDHIPSKLLTLSEAELNIPPDSFIYSTEYKNFLVFRSLSDTINSAISERKQISEDLVAYYKTLNPDYFEAYLILGDYYFSRENYIKAKEYYKLTLLKEYNSKAVNDYVEEQLAKCN